MLPSEVELGTHELAIATATVSYPMSYGLPNHLWHNQVGVLHSMQHYPTLRAFIALRISASRSLASFKATARSTPPSALHLPRWRHLQLAVA
jgi:hypothetical protein